MAKRFTDTDKWKRQSFRELHYKAKLAFMYLCDQCDYCGIWHADFPQMSFHLGFPITDKDFVAWFGDKVVRFDEDKYFITAFFEFQYGDAKEGFRAKQSALARLQKLGLMDSRGTVTRQSPDSHPTVQGVSPDTPSIVEYSVVDSFEGGVGETLEAPASKSKTFGPREIAAAWNERMASAKNAKGNHMPMVDLELFGPKQADRWAAAKARLEEKPDREYWTNVIDRIARSEFCRGKNDRGWVASIDFLLRPKTHIAVMEGQYGCTPRKTQQAAVSQPQTQAPKHDPTLTEEQRQAKAEELRKMMARVGNLGQLKQEMGT